MIFYDEGSVYAMESGVRMGQQTNCLHIVDGNKAPANTVIYLAYMGSKINK
jgi:hypothetical protein